MTIFFPGIAGDYESVLDGRASGGLIINDSLIIDPGIGFLIKSGLKNADQILISDKDLLYCNDANAIIKRFNAKIVSETDDIKQIGNSFKILTNKYFLGYIHNPKLTKAFAEEFKDMNILVIRTESTSIEDMINLIEYVNPELAILTGFRHNIDPLLFSRHVKDELKKYKEHLKTQIIAAKDGMKINPDSYNIKSSKI